MYIESDNYPSHKSPESFESHPESGRPGTERIERSAERLYQDVKDRFDTLKEQYRDHENPERNAWEELLRADDFLRAVWLNATTNIEEYNQGIVGRNSSLKERLEETDEDYIYYDAYAESEVPNFGTDTGWEGEDFASLLHSLEQKLGIPASEEQAEATKRDLVEGAIMGARMAYYAGEKGMRENLFGVTPEQLIEKFGNSPEFANFTTEDWAQCADIIRTGETINLNDSNWWQTATEK